MAVTVGVVDPWARVHVLDCTQLTIVRCLLYLEMSGHNMPPHPAVVVEVGAVGTPVQPGVFDLLLGIPSRHCHPATEQNSANTFATHCLGRSTDLSLKCTGPFWTALICAWLKQVMVYCIGPSLVADEQEAITKIFPYNVGTHPWCV